MSSSKKLQSKRLTDTKKVAGPLLRQIDAMPWVQWGGDASAEPGSLDDSGLSVKRDDAFPELPELVDPSQSFFQQIGVAAIPGGMFTTLKESDASRKLKKIQKEVDWREMGLTGGVSIATQPKTAEDRLHDISSYHLDHNELGLSRKLRLKSPRAQWQLRRSPMVGRLLGQLLRYISLGATGVFDVKSVEGLQLEELGLVSGLKLRGQTSKSTIEMASFDVKAMEGLQLEELGLVSGLKVRSQTSKLISAMASFDVKALEGLQLEELGLVADLHLKGPTTVNNNMRGLDAKTVEGLQLEELGIVTKMKLRGPT